LGKDDFLPAIKPKRILLVGGGPAGSEAARILAERGHRAVLLEKETALGGKLQIAAAPPHKEEMMTLPRFYSYELKRLGVTVKLQAEFTPGSDAFDGIIVAGGANEKTLEIKGMENLPCYSSSQILSGKVRPQDPVVIVGAGLVGGETAHLLCSQGFKTSLVEILKKPFADMGISTRWVLMGNLKKAGVSIYTSSEVIEVKEGQVVVQTPEEKITLPAGCVVFAVGYEPDQALTEQIEGLGVPFCVIGDIKKPRRIKDAVHEGYWAATEWVDGLG
jgi:pyruvate/2-oxoglutarate dehydrogenase complex dihydrolipoamide dehydrogenase (E3) component